MSTSETDTAPKSLLTPAEAARYLGLPTVKTLERWRQYEGEGPPWVVLNRRLVRYRVTDLDDYLGARTVHGAAEARLLREPSREDTDIDT